MISPMNQTVTTADPNTQRVIQELASVINDVELRLHLVRVGLAQAFPQLSPTLGLSNATSPGANILGGFGTAGIGSPALGIHAGIPGLVNSPANVLSLLNPLHALLSPNAPLNTANFAMIPGLLEAVIQRNTLGLQGLPFNGIGTPTGYGTTPSITGVTTPFGINPASLAPFRW